MIPGKYHVPFPLLAERYFGAGEVAKSFKPQLIVLGAANACVEGGSRAPLPSALSD